MKQVKTARGRVIDMGALAKANEEIRAVSPGNVVMNARGDRLDASGNVVATVQKVARKQHENAQAPEKRRLSDAPGAPKKAPVRKNNVSATSAEEVGVVSRTEKTRDDGTRYVEIEYDDGSMDVEELK